MNAYHVAALPIARRRHSSIGDEQVAAKPLHSQPHGALLRLQNQWTSLAIVALAQVAYVASEGAANQTIFA